MNEESQFNLNTTGDLSAPAVLAMRQCTPFQLAPVAWCTCFSQGTEDINFT